MLPRVLLEVQKIGDEAQGVSCVGDLGVGWDGMDVRLCDVDGDGDGDEVGVEVGVERGDEG